MRAATQACIQLAKLGFTVTGTSLTIVFISIFESLLWFSASPCFGNRAVKPPRCARVLQCDSGCMPNRGHSYVLAGRRASLLPRCPCNDEPCSCLSDKAHSTLPSSAFVSITHSSSFCLFLPPRRLSSTAMPHTHTCRLFLWSVPAVRLAPQEHLSLYLQTHSSHAAVRRFCGCVTASASAQGKLGWH